MTGVSRVEDLVVWQLAVALRDELFGMTENGRAARDFGFRNQIRDASSSVSNNIAEGFDLFKPRLFAKHVRIARGSLGETRNTILEGKQKKYFNEADAARCLKLAYRTRRAITEFLKYLDSCKGEAPTGWDSTAAKNSAQRKRRKKAEPPEPPEPPEPC